MSKQTLNEATLVAPVFSGTDEQVAQCTSAWSSIISSIAYSCSRQGSEQMSDENLRALFGSLRCHVNVRFDELHNITMPPAAMPGIAFEPPVVAQQGVEIDFASFAESTKPMVTESSRANLKRMRELAGIPHPTNRV